MADNLSTGEFWLPPEFLTGDYDDEVNLNSNNLKATKFSYNSKSAYSFGSYGSSLSSSSAFSSPVESVVGSTETESDEDEDYSHTGLTRRSYSKPNQRCNSMSTSPQSTLWSGRRAAVPTPVTGDGGSWDLLLDDVAGQVAEMKMDGGDEGVLFIRGCAGHVGPSVGPVYSQHSPPIGRGRFYGSQVPINYHFEQARQNQVMNKNYSSILGRPTWNNSLHWQIQLRQNLMTQRRKQVLGRIGFEENGMYVNSSMNLPHYPRPLLQIQQQMNQTAAASLRSSSGTKQACAGTGVFIPRPHINPLDARKKSVTAHSTVQHPPRTYKAMNRNLNLAAGQELTTPSDGVMAAQLQQRLGYPPEVPRKHEQCLPQEWTY